MDKFEFKQQYAEYETTTKEEAQKVANHIGMVEGDKVVVAKLDVVWTVMLESEYWTAVNAGII